MNTQTLITAVSAFSLLVAVDPAPGQTVNVLGFDAQKNGLKFSNSTWPPSPPWTINLPIIGNISFGDAGKGMCGGMSYMVCDCFEANLLPPATTANPPTDSPLFTYIAARFTQSLDYDDAVQQMTWITKGDADLVTHMVTEEWPRVKSVIDSGEPCPLALTHGHTVITDINGIVASLGLCHQVLAYGYTLQGNNVTVRIWDPNNPSNGNETIQINLDIQGLTDTRALNWTTFEGNNVASSLDGFRGFFRSHYSFKDPRRPTTAAFLAQAVSSPGVSGLQPLPPVAVQRTWAQAGGNPLIRFTGGVHDLSVRNTSFCTDAGKPIDQLMATIVTGGDDLRGGTGPDDNADIFLTVGGNLGNRTLTFNNINCNQQWNNGEVHKVILPLPAGAVSGDIVSLRLHTQFGGGVGGDNWNVNGITITGFLPLTAGPSPAPVTRNWLDATGNPLVRFTGSLHDWSNPIAQSGTDAGRPIMKLNLTVTTGGDDLRAGTGPDDNADVILTLADGQKITFSNINQSQNWPNGSVNLVTLPIPSGLDAGEIANLDLHTQFGGGIGGDNWNVNKLDLEATLDSSCPPSGNGNNGGQPVERTWVNATGNYIVRFTGSTHDWSTPIQNTTADNGKPIQRLQLTVTTGSDDLRGGGNASDNADVILSLSNGQKITINNINQGQDWGNNSVNTVTLAIPSGLQAGQVTSLDLHTQFGGGLGGDNWNVNGLRLVATIQ
jgi:hypothetical protein